VEQLGEAGLPVALEVEGPARDLPPGVDLSAYRIVQEALTNVLRHAGPARARVRLAYAADALEIEVADDGLGSPPEAGAVGGGADLPASDGGHGLIGMRERVAMFGGELRAGPAPGGGFAVRAVLPLSTTATRADA
jgi:signal transduction histidine kinase